VQPLVPSLPAAPLSQDWPDAPAPKVQVDAPRSLASPLLAPPLLAPPSLASLSLIRAGGPPASGA